MSSKQKDSRQPVLFSPAERKIFVVFVYYLFSGALHLTTFSIYVRDISHNFTALADYFNCQRSGLGDSCTLDTKKNPIWALLSFIVLFLFPVINLYFAVKLSDLKVLCVFLCQKFSPTHHNSSSTSKPARH